MATRSFCFFTATLPSYWRDLWLLWGYALLRAYKCIQRRTHFWVMMCYFKRLLPYAICVRLCNKICLNVSTALPVFILLLQQLSALWYELMAWHNLAGNITHAIDLTTSRLEHDWIHFYTFQLKSQRPIVPVTQTCTCMGTTWSCFCCFARHIVTDERLLIGRPLILQGRSTHRENDGRFIGWEIFGAKFTLTRYWEHWQMTFWLVPRTHWCKGEDLHYECADMWFLGWSYEKFDA